MRRPKLVAALSIAGAMSLVSYVPVQAAPITPLSSVAKPNAEAGASAIQVRWGGWGWGVGAFAAGALVGAAIASPYYYGGYYPYYGYGGYPYYGYPYYPGYGYSRPWRPYYGYRPYWRSYGAYRPYGVYGGW